MPRCRGVAGQTASPCPHLVVGRGGDVDCGVARRPLLRKLRVALREHAMSRLGVQRLGPDPEQRDAALELAVRLRALLGIRAVMGNTIPQNGNKAAANQPAQRAAPVIWATLS